MSGDIQKRFVDFALGLTWEKVTPDMRAVLKLSLLDWCAVGRAGAGEAVAGPLHKMLGAEENRGKAAVFGHSRLLPPREAALANGTISHALDYDDTHFLHIGHPAVVIFPAVLAVAQHVGASGRAFLEAALTGYEVSIRFGHWLGRSHYEAGFHMTATAGCFGAAMAVGRLLGADHAQMQAAVGLAATRASGLKAQFGSMGKPYNAGLAAANGVEAGLLAVAGMTSDAQGMESFAASHCGERNAAAVAGLGEQYVSETVSHKFHACCHGTHAALEALAKLDVSAQEVEMVHISVHPRWLKVCNLAEPSTGLEAKFSYRMCAAFLLAGLDTGRPETFSDSNCRREDLCVLRDQVVVAKDDTLPDTAARVRAVCHNGMVRQVVFDLEQPTPIAERTKRVKSKAVTLLGKRSAQAIWRKIDNLPTGLAADNLMQLIRD